ncbi:MAG: hypothetical protein Kow0029_16290 [Candidatus Rifleibacteriota bacterium]
MHTRFEFKELEEFSHYLAQEYGLKFSHDKYSFLENRIFPIMQEFGCRKLSDVVLQCKRDIKLRMELLNALTTNETWFFRHPSHFKILADYILPRITEKGIKTKDNRIKIWSAGCSIGAELFSIIITVLEKLKNPESWNLTFIGSDISTDAISRARSGKFNKHELRFVESSLRNKYFKQCGTDCYLLNPEIVKMADFEVLNLLDRWPARKLDVIFCRNVMIYFDEKHKKKLTEKFLNSLNQDGFYLTSANESIHWQTSLGLKKLFIENEYIYQKSAQKESFRLYQFSTPSDLLRALNLLNQSGLPYKLEKIPQSHKLAPKRAIFISQKDSIQADELFSLSSIKVSSSRPYQK